MSYTGQINLRLPHGAKRDYSSVTRRKTSSPISRLAAMRDAAVHMSVIGHRIEQFWGGNGGATSMLGSPSPLWLDLQRKRVALM
jgi:hypothetical protein